MGLFSKDENINNKYGVEESKVNQILSDKVGTFTFEIGGFDFKVRYHNVGYFVDEHNFSLYVYKNGFKIDDVHSSELFYLFEVIDEMIHKYKELKLSKVILSKKEYDGHVRSCDYLVKYQDMLDVREQWSKQEETITFYDLKEGVTISYPSNSIYEVRFKE